MASASIHRLNVKSAKTSKSLTERARVEEALKQAAAHARRQLSTQGLKLPTQGWKRSTIHNPVV